MKEKNVELGFMNLNSPKKREFAEKIIAPFEETNHSFKVFKEWFTPIKRSVESGEIEEISIEEMVSSIGINKTLRLFFLSAIGEKGGYKKEDFEYGIIF